LEDLKSLSTSAQKPEETTFYYALALHFNEQYKDALKFYNQYIQTGTNAKLVSQARENAKACKYALAILPKKQAVTFVNAGKKVNSKFPEYNPFVMPDEGYMFYVTQKEGTTGHVYDAKGYFASDIYISKYKYGNWTRGRSVGQPNSYGNEKVTSISENGKYIVYYVDNPLSKNNLQVAENRKKYSFNPPKKIDDKRINNNSGKQHSGVFSNDGNTFIFSSKRNGGLGGYDLYIVKKLPTGKWGEPQNMGPEINTEKDEIYPYLYDNGQTLYFSSNGHNTIGGFDLQKSTYDNVAKKWNSPENLGLPINTPFDDYTICFGQNKKTAYVGMWRKDGFGEKDIYQLIFENEEPLYTTINAKVMYEDSSQFTPALTIEVYNEKDELTGIYTKKQDKGSFIMVLPPGKYKINLLQNDNIIYQESIFVKDHNLYKDFVEKKIILKGIPKQE
ncbi:MAG TPA: hypothetical protein DIU39_08810, partial [Flavobacteriales bacterium]|nr:hypothetical protein [Flavobacteriales bacterium]